MKTKLVLAVTLFGAATLASLAGVDVGIQVNVPPPPRVVVAPPAVVVAPPAVAVYPETYVWDGYENVGIVNGVYFYLGPGNVWLPLPGDRLVRFHAWERDHRDWHKHAIRNERFRGGHERGEREHSHDHGHDRR